MTQVVAIQLIGRPADLDQALARAAAKSTYPEAGSPVNQTVAPAAPRKRRR